jgi:hypothetical protein
MVGTMRRVNVRPFSNKGGRLVETHSTILPSLKKVLLALLAPPTPISTITPGRLYAAKGNRGAPILTLKLSPLSSPDKEENCRFRVLCREESKVQEVFLSTGSEQMSRSKLAGVFTKILKKEIRKNKVKIVLSKDKKVKKEGDDKEDPLLYNPFTAPFLRRRSS